MDRIQRFLFDHTNVRGELVTATDTCREVRARHDYPAPVARQLDEMVTAAALLTATIKLDGVLSLEVRGDGPVSLLMAESRPATEERGQQLRAIARFNDQTGLSETSSASLSELVGNGQIVMTLDPQGGQRYQGIVGLESATLAGCLETYFERSEQLPTRLWLAADEQAAAGLLLQQLPEETSTRDPDAWNRLVMLADTVKPQELLQLTPTETLTRLFHEDNPRVFEPTAIGFGCTCSRERFAQGLYQLGAEELRDIVAEQGEIATQCHFCNTRYVFSAAAVESLIESPDDSSPIVH